MPQLSAEPMPTTSREQFYASVSRCIEAVTIYTDDKASPVEAASDSAERLAATELLKRPQRVSPTRKEGVKSFILTSIN